MAPLPPPPPPAAPPPPPMAGPPKLAKSGTTDRNALLSQIRGGAKLKKAVEVNDRSSPIIDGKASSGTAAKSSSSSSVGGVKPTSNGPMQLGGLFAGGVPKLRSTGSKLVTNGPSNSVNNVNNTNSNIKAGDSQVRSMNSTSTIKASLAEKLQFHQQTNNNNNNNSFLHSNDSNSLITNKNKYHTINLSKPRERPNFMSSEGKGQAPQVPTVTLNNGTAPSLPKKPPGVQRSNSQSNSRTGNSVGRALRPGPPNMKPPPPPKITNGNSNAPQPPFPSKPLNANRRQSYGEDQQSNASDLRNGRSDTSISSIVSSFEQQGMKPPAPPRNGSVPNGFSQSPAYPPPPPPISTIPSRSNSSAVRSPHANKTAPPVPNITRSQSSVRPPLGPPPPPPPHRNANNGSSLYPSPPPPPPPSQTKVIPTALRNGLSSGPPPPVRNTSMSRDDFASRFATFKAIFELPAPYPMTNSNKLYSSHTQQSMRRRDPPPPPPQSNGLMAHNSPNSNAHYNSNNKKFSSSNPMLHIQIGSSVSQC